MLQEKEKRSVGKGGPTSGCIKKQDQKQKIRHIAAEEEKRRGHITTLQAVNASREKTREKTVDKA